MKYWILRLFQVLIISCTTKCQLNARELVFNVMFEF